jgi:hypothetical protein
MPDEAHVFAQTPELDSLVLFGSGATGLATFARFACAGAGAGGKATLPPAGWGQC